MHVQNSIACHAYIWLKTPVDTAEKERAPPQFTKDSDSLPELHVGQTKFHTQYVYIYVYVYTFTNRRDFG